jgi:D-beta-D-heptose 7-phosphate kinase/D-beta-D-heptose 1-phosphate adenosyltransferase
MTGGALAGVVDAFARQRIVIVGEAMLDTKLHGHADRLSREAPVPIVTLDRRVDAPGGAANTAANIAALGAEPLFVSIVGDDDEGERLTAALRAGGVGTEHVLTAAGRETLAKQRIMAGDQMLVRFDTGAVEPVAAADEDRLIRRLLDLAPTADAILFSDYGYGVISDRILAAVQELGEQRPPVIVDARDLRRYRRIGPIAVKPNYAEAVRLLGEREVREPLVRERQVGASGEKLLDVTGARIAAVTIDSDGAFIFERDRPSHRTYARPASNSRAAGAGDTFTAALTLAVAGEIASAAAAIVVAKPGTSLCRADELIASFAHAGKVVADAAALARFVERWRAAGRRIVFTNGCFDILHRGHVSYLNRAKALGDVLVVAVNSDASVRRLKGPDRPVNPLADRLEVLAALSCVDNVIAFPEPTPERLIRIVRPEVFVKGGDYARESLPEAPLVEALGGSVRILPYLEDHSTTGLIARMRAEEAHEGATAAVEPVSEAGR